MDVGKAARMRVWREKVGVCKYEIEGRNRGLVSVWEQKEQVHAKEYT